MPVTPFATAFYFILVNYLKFTIQRIHFASAMTMTGNNEDTIKEQSVGYLDIAEFIQYNSASIEEDLKQLWQRIVFNIAVSNTDDHLRNHGFLLGKKGWSLSLAFDINPSIEKDGLALNIDTDSNALDLGLAKNVGQYFGLTQKQMEQIISKTTQAVSNWKKIATRLGIPRPEQQLMEAAFKS